MLLPVVRIIPIKSTMCLAFPYLFRAALDCRASVINEDMKVAAAYAIAALAREPVSRQVKGCIPARSFVFGPDYILPKPFDRRLLSTVPPAVVKAAMDSGVCERPIDDLGRYGRILRRYVNDSDKALRAFLVSSVGVFIVIQFLKIDLFGYRRGCRIARILSFIHATHKKQTPRGFGSRGVCYLGAICVSQS